MDTGLCPDKLDHPAPSEFPFFKSPYIDEKNILHWFAYLSDEAYEFRNLPLSDWVKEASSEMTLFCNNNQIKITEPIFTINELPEYSFREIHGKAGII